MQIAATLVVYAEAWDLKNASFHRQISDTFTKVSLFNELSRDWFSTTAMHFVWPWGYAYVSLMGINWAVKVKCAVASCRNFKFFEILLNFMAYSSTAEFDLTAQLRAQCSASLHTCECLNCCDSCFWTCVLSSLITISLSEYNFCIRLLNSRWIDISTLRKRVWVSWNDGKEKLFITLRKRSTDLLTSKCCWLTSMQNHSTLNSRIAYRNLPNLGCRKSPKVRMLRSANIKSLICIRPRSLSLHFKSLPAWR